MPADLRKQVEQELLSGHFRNSSELIQEAVRQFFSDRQRGLRRLDALRRLGRAVDDTGLFEFPLKSADARLS